MTHREELTNDQGELMGILVTTDDGAGTVTKESQYLDGSVTSELLTGQPSLQDVSIKEIAPLQELDARALIAAKALILSAGDIWDALVLVPLDDPTKPFLDAVATIILTAALPLVEA